MFLGPLMFGFHSGQAEAPKIMAKKVKIKFYFTNSFNLYSNHYSLLYVHQRSLKIGFVVHIII